MSSGHAPEANRIWSCVLHSGVRRHAERSVRQFLPVPEQP